MHLCGTGGSLIVTVLYRRLPNYRIARINSTPDPNTTTYYRTQFEQMQKEEGK